MNDVTIHLKKGHSFIIPVANLQQTMDQLGDRIKKVDYGTAPKPPTTKVTESKPSKTWKQKKLLKYARSKGDETLKDNAKKDDILDVIKTL